MILVFLIIFPAIFLKTYDSFKYKGIYIDNKINISVLKENVDDIITSDYLEINGTKFKFSIESVSQMEYEPVTNQIYQTVFISISKKLIENENFDITFYKNKQRIITKVFNLLK